MSGASDVAIEDSSAFVRSRLVEVLRPKPSSLRLTRVGGGGDGAYLVPEGIVSELEACFSAGCENRKQFEDELLHRFGLDSFLLDKSSSIDQFATPLITGKQFFTKKWLAEKSAPDSISLEDWIQTTPYRDSRRLLLQLDIEEAEWAVFSGIHSGVLRQFSVLVVEFHGLCKRIRNSEFHAEVLSVLDRLESLYVSIHVRVNNCCDAQVVGEDPRLFPQVIEVTLVRRDLLGRSSEAKLNRAMVPHPLDIFRNVREKPPQHLSSEWRKGHLALRELIKIVLDWVIYLPLGGGYFYSVIRRNLFHAIPRGSHKHIKRVLLRSRR